jgi:hypothetical protein
MTAPLFFHNRGLLTRTGGNSTGEIDLIPMKEMTAAESATWLATFRPVAEDRSWQAAKEAASRWLLV